MTTSSRKHSSSSSNSNEERFAAVRLVRYDGGWLALPDASLGRACAGAQCMVLAVRRLYGLEAHN